MKNKSSWVVAGDRSAFPDDKPRKTFRRPTGEQSTLSLDGGFNKISENT